MNFACVTQFPVQKQYMRLLGLCQLMSAEKKVNKTLSERIEIRNPSSKCITGLGMGTEEGFLSNEIQKPSDFSVKIKIFH